ncbi:MAG: hypothetical protein RR315_03875 [Oscillospiraceae bacterium]
MKKLFAAFKNLTFEGAVKIGNLEISADISGNLQLVQEFDGYESEKLAMRNVELLRCHLIAAAYFCGENFLLVKPVIWRSGEEEPQNTISRESIKLRKLLPKIPLNLELTAPTLTWFSKYLLEDEKNFRQRVFLLYNAFGGLCGYDNIIKSADSQEKKELLTLFIEKVRDYKREDEISEDETYSEKIQFTEKDIKLTEEYYICSLKKTYTIYN